MILQALYDYYQRKAADPESKIAPQGYEWKEIPIIITIDNQGNFVNLEDTRDGVSKNKRAQSFLVLKSKGRSGSNAYQSPNIFWDHYGFVLGQPKENDTKKTKDELIQDARKQQDYFKRQILTICKKNPNNKEFIAVKRFLENQLEIDKVLTHPNWKDCIKIPGCNITFRLVGELLTVAENEDLRSFVNNEVQQNDSEKKEPVNIFKEGICLITGENSQIAILHTATSLPGGKAGGKLVGFQKNSGYDSYYKEQGLNAPVSIKAESAYTTALNVLLGKDSKNKFRLGDSSVVFWSEKKTAFESQFVFAFSSVVNDNPDNNVSEVKTMLESIWTGKYNDEGDTLFYILGLAPNSARISVRFWRKGRVRDFAEKIALHFEDLNIVRGRKDDKEYFSLYNLLANIALEYKLDNIAPNLVGKVIESVLDGTIYPVTLQQQCLRRIKADQNINRVRAAILKAYLNRKNRIFNNNNEKSITMALDLENTNQGYLCGRLFAVLEKIQEEAQPGINSTIKDRYYGAASTSPVTVFGRILSLSNHHLAKLNPGRKVNFEKLIQEVISNVNSSGMPSHLTLDDQSRFAIGYYQQRQDFFKGKEQ